MNCLLGIFSFFFILIFQTNNVNSIQNDTTLDVFGAQLIWDILSQKCPFWSKKFLWILYDVKHGEGFYLQKNVFYRMSLTIAILNETIQKKKKSDLVVLVLPPFCNIAHWNFNKKRRLSWSKFYKITQNKILTLEYDILKVLMGFSTFESDVIGLSFNWNDKFADKDYSIKIYNNEKNFNWHINSNCKFNEYINNGMFLFAGYCEYIQINSLVCLEYYKLMRSKEIADSINELHQLTNKKRKLSFYLIKCADGILVAWPWELNKYGLLDILQHSEYIKKKSKLYMLKNSSFFNGKSYISIHLRRGDFTIVRSSEIPTFNQVVSRIMRLSDKINSRRIVVSTDGTEEEKKLLKSLFKDSGFTLHILDVSFEHEEGVMSAISQFILLQGQYFIGTKDSRFSSSVAWDCVLKERSKTTDGLEPNFENCNEYFCGKNEKRDICREYNDRLPT